MTSTQTKVTPSNVDDKHRKELNIPTRFINPMQAQNYLEVFTVKRHGNVTSSVSDCVNKIPLFNVLYHAFLNHDAIDNEYLRGFLDLIGVTTGLMLSAVVALPLSIDYSEIEQTRKRFAHAPYNMTRWGRTAKGVDPLIVQLTMYTTGSIYMLGTSVALVLMFFFFSGMQESNALNVPKIIRKDWWRLHKFLIIFIFFTSLFGMMSSYMAINRFSIVKMPDLYVEGIVDCADSSAQTCAAGRDVKIPSGMDSTYGALLTWGYFFLIGSILLSWTIHSIPIMRKVCIEKQVYHHYDGKLKRWNEERTKILMFFTYITKRWDMADKLVDAYNPFLKDMSNASNKGDDDTLFFLGARVVDAGEDSKHRHSNIAKDPRVMKAFAVLQKYGYVTWKSFILDFKQSLRPAMKDINNELLPKYDEFTPRMKWSLIEYVNKLTHNKEWKFENNENNDEWWGTHYEKEIEHYVKSEMNVLGLDASNDWEVNVSRTDGKDIRRQITKKGTMKIKGDQ